jgi:hypothetical protein
MPAGCFGADFLAADLFVADFFAAGFFVAGFFAAGFLVAGFFAADFFAGFAAGRFFTVAISRSLSRPGGDRSACARGNDKQLHAVKTAQDLLAPNKPSYTRIGGAMALGACRERIEVDDLLQKLTNDRDREVADEAKRALRRR